MECATTIARFIGPLVGPLVGQQFGYVISYKSNVDKLKAEVQKLKDMMENSEDIADAVTQRWPNDVKDADKLIDEDSEGHGEVRCLNWLFPNPCQRRVLSMEAEKMAQKVSAIIAEIMARKALPPSARGYESLFSRTSTLNEIKQALKDPNTYMIGVYGMGGVGKSTLMKELAWQAEKEGSFGAVIVAYVTRTPDLRRIQDQLAEGMGLKLNSKEIDGRAGELRGRIIQAKSILVILDDIWGDQEEDKTRILDLAELGIPYGKDHKGCKLVLTSRDSNVLNKMGTQTNFSLGVLSKEESWDLFEKTADNVVKLDRIKRIAVDVANCCYGLPLCIVTVAKALRKKDDVRTWQDSLTRLKRSDHVALHQKVYSNLEFSYDCLETQEHKSLFLFLGSSGLYSWSTEPLLPFCWGLGLYQNVDTLADARIRHDTLINDLLASSLFLGRDSQRVIVMHDLVRDLAKCIASTIHPTIAWKTLTRVQEWPKIELLRMYHRFIVSCNFDELPEQLEWSELELFMANGLDTVVPDNIFSRMRKVKVLYLEQVTLTKASLSSLPHLKNLRSLTLSWCHLGDISIVGELTNLEFLTLEEIADIVELPKEIGYLTRLRMLKVTDCRDLRLIPKNLLSCLKCLEELYMVCCHHIQWEVEGSNNQSNYASLGELRNLHKLTTLELTIVDGSVFPKDMRHFEELKRYFICIGMEYDELVYKCDDFERSLQLSDSLDSNILLNDGVRLLFTTVQSLRLNEPKCVRNIVPELCESGFAELKYLCIEGSTELLHIINSERDPLHHHHAFPSLETLELYKLENMEEICHGPIPAQSFDMLKKLEVSGCNKLKNLFDEKITLPNLETLLIHEMDNLKSIWSHNRVALNSFCKLNTIRILSCPSLLSVFPSLSMFNNLQNLKTLEATRCDELRVIFEVPGLNIDAISQQQVPTTHLTTLELIFLPKLKRIWSKDPRGILRFRNLCTMEVKYCESLDHVFPISVAGDLHQLKHLRIHKSGIEDIVEKSDTGETKRVLLEELLLYQCPWLKTIVPSSVVFPNLAMLTLNGCHGLVNVMTSPLATSLPNLRVMEIYSCGMIEEIVASDQNDGDTPSEIAFMKLEILRLEGLKSLKSFCKGSFNFKFPLLTEVRLVDCPMMETFCNGNLTAPSLTMVYTSWPRPIFDEEEEVEKEKVRWDGDLNTTIGNLFAEKAQALSGSSSHNSEQRSFRVLTESEEKEQDFEQEFEEEDAGKTLRRTRSL